MIDDCPLYYGSWWGRSEAYQLLECPLRISNNLLKDFGWKTSNLGSCGCGSKLGTLPSTNSITNMGKVKSLSKTCFRCEIWWFFHAHISTWKRHPGIPRKWMMQNPQFLAHKFRAGPLIHFFVRKSSGFVVPPYFYRWGPSFIPIQPSVGFSNPFWTQTTAITLGTLQKAI